MNKKKFNQIFTAGALITIAGALLKLLTIQYAAYIFSIGAAMIIILQLLNTLNAKDEDFRQQRLTRIALISSLFLAVAAYFMFKDANSWVVFVLLYALTSLFLSYRMK